MPQNMTNWEGIRHLVRLHWHKNDILTVLTGSNGFCYTVVVNGVADGQTRLKLRCKGAKVYFLSLQAFM